MHDLQLVLLPLLSFTIVVSQMVVIFVAVHLILSPIVCISTYHSITTLKLSPPVIAALNRSTLIYGIPLKIVCVPDTVAVGFAGLWPEIRACILSSISTV